MSYGALISCICVLGSLPFVDAIGTEVAAKNNQSTGLGFEIKENIAGTPALTMKIAQYDVKTMETPTRPEKVGHAKTNRDYPKLSKLPKFLSPVQVQADQSTNGNRELFIDRSPFQLVTPLPSRSLNNSTALEDLNSSRSQTIDTLPVISSSNASRDHRSKNTPTRLKSNKSTVYRRNAARKKKYNKVAPDHGKDNRPEVLAGVILPVSGDRPFRVAKVKPALERAVDELSAVDVKHRWNFKRSVF